MPISPITPRYSVKGLLLGFEAEAWHEQLGKQRTVKGPSEYLVQLEAQSQLAEWEARWQERVARQNLAASREASKGEAERLTAEAQELQASLESLLRFTLDRNDAVQWELLKVTAPFSKPKPVPTPSATRQPRKEAPREPTIHDIDYVVQLGFLDRLIASRKAQKEGEAKSRFEADHVRWENDARRIREENEAEDKRHQQAKAATEAQYQRNVAAWEVELRQYEEEARTRNAFVDEQKQRYLSGDPVMIAPYCDMVLEFSEYPNCILPSWETDYNPETRLLIVNYSLPAPGDLPTLSEVRFLPTKGDFTEKRLTAAQAEKLYDSVVYQIALRTVHELFEADVVNAIESIAFNGFVRSIDKATGNEVNPCILSLQVRRAEFLAINLASVDPKACFKQLKGVGSSKLHSITPVAPLVTMRREDGRFVSAYEVASHLNEGYNLAAMDWEDFEHLIRQLFEQIYATSGGEVKVTQASRDGGVDAVVFDPDPIRGGKTVIQAKRYTATVPVSAVRDLYGTVMNEGATKGILVTTSDFGPDAHEFARGKPLTLLNGGNLLHLLEQQGHKARIDLREARQIGLARQHPTRTT